MVKITLTKDALKDALAILAPSTKKKEGLITACLLFDVKPDFVTIRASDRFVYTSHTISSTEGLVLVEGEGSFTLEVSRLSQWVNNVGDDDILMNAYDSSVLLSCGKVESPFSSQDPTLFTSHTIFETQLEASTSLFQIDVGTIIEALSFVKTFVSTKDDNNDPSRRFQTTALRDGLFLGTDSKLIAIYKDPTLGDGLKIGQDQISQVLSYLKRQNDAAPLEVKSTEKFFFLKISEESWFGFVKPQADLPDLSDLPTELSEDTIFDADKASLKSALAVLQATAEETDTEVHAKVSGQGDNAVLVLSMKSLKKDQASVDLPVKVSKMAPEGEEFSFNSGAFGQVIGAYDGEISLAFNTEKSFLKFYQRLDTGASKVCLMSLSYT
jgi:hypothetical protein